MQLEIDKRISELNAKIAWLEKCAKSTRGNGRELRSKHYRDIRDGMLWAKRILLG